ncbi:MAG: aldehyde dehydrogenase [Bacteroidetes bacterium]|nr:aldehyde dehydrogenase [Bacteroidota bacterium]
MDILNYIDGTLVGPRSDAWLDSVEPATGTVHARLPRSNADDVQAAVEAAERAFPMWSALTAAQRSEIMLAIARGIKERFDELAEAESMDQGKPVWLAKAMDIPRAVDNISFFATEILHTHTRAFETNTSVINYTLRQPIGVVGCISPWNLPLYLFTWKIAPALAAGNCVVAKPSELTPLTAFLFSQICIDAGLPPGVLNIVHGLGAECGKAIVAHPKTKAISFTGGTVTGADIARTAAPMFKKLSLELGGKNPTLVFADVDVDAVAKKVARASFTNQGEICLCGSRIFVQRPIYDAFKQALLREIATITVGDPRETTSRNGALVSEQHLEKVLSYIDLARAEGGTVLCGGERVHLEGRCANGYFVAPTLIEGLGTECRVNQEEIFGPVATIIPFDTEDEALRGANSTTYGLAASVWTNDVSRVHRVARLLESGIVWVNTWLERDLRTPFGGVKSSGVGREGGEEALRFFTEAKNVCIQF